MTGQARDEEEEEEEYVITDTSSIRADTYK